MAKDRTDAPAPNGVDLDSMPRALRDFIDLNNEYAGRVTGRVTRFLTAEREDGSEEQKQEKRERFSRLLALLQDPGYARAYFELEDMTERASVAVDAALAENVAQTDEARERLKALTDDAPELADGRKMFRTGAGRVFAEDGEEITDPTEVERAKSAPGWNEFLRRKAELERLETERRAIEDYQRNTLNPAKEALEDEEHPRTQEELERRAKELYEAMPDKVRARFDGIAAPATPPQMTAAPTIENGAASDYLSAPVLAGAPDATADFGAARDAATTALPTATPDFLPKNKR